MTVRYIVPKNVVTNLETISLSPPAFKMVHGVLMHADIAVDGQTSLLWMALQEARVISTSFLRAELGMLGDKGNRSLKRAIADQELKRVFDRVELTENGRALLCKVRQQFVETAKVRNFDPGNLKHEYAFLCSEQVGACKTDKDILFLTRALMHGRQNYPVFDLPGVGTPELVSRVFGKRTALQRRQAELAALHSLATKHETLPWPKVRDRWIAAATRSAAITGDRFVLHIQRALTHPGILRVRVRGVCKTSKWLPQKLYACSPGSRIVEADAAGSCFLSRAEIEERKAKRNVPGQG